MCDDLEVVPRREGGWGGKEACIREIMISDL